MVDRGSDRVNVKQEGMPLRTIIIIALGMVIGSGVVSLVGPAITATGQSAGLAYMAAVVLGLMLILPGIFIASTIKVDGGEYRMVQALMGKMCSGIFVWNFIITQVGLSMTSLAMGSYVNALIPQISVNVGAFATITIFYIVNLFGLKIMSRVQYVLVGLLLVALIVFGCFGLANLSPDVFNITSDGYFSGGISGFLTATVLLSSSTTSHQLLFGLGGSVSNSRKSLPKALFITSGIIFVLFGLVGFVASNVLPVEQVAGKTLVLVAQKILPLPVYLFFMVCGPMLAICSTFNGIFPAVAWTLYSAAQNGWFPKATLRLNRFGAPYFFLTVLYLVAVVPIVAGFTIQEATSLMLLVIYINKLVLLVGAFRLPKKYPQLWGESIMHIPNSLYYIIIGICTIIQVMTIVISGLDISRGVLIVAICSMTVFSAIAIYRSKYVEEAS